MEVIQHIALRVDSEDVDEKIRRIERRLSKQFVFGIHNRRQKLAEREKQIKDIVDKMVKLDGTVK